MAERLSTQNVILGAGVLVAAVGLAATIAYLAKQSKRAAEPEQTRAHEQFEIAREAYRRKLYPECLRALDKAIEHYELDWRFHQMAGTIRSGLVDGDQLLVDLVRAEENFIKAGRLAAAADDASTAGRAFLSAAYMAYRQEKLTEALAHCKAAYSLDSAFAEARFLAAKLSAAKDDMPSALVLLDEAIKANKRYALEAASDQDLLRHRDDLIAYLRARADKALNELDQALSIAKAAFEEIPVWDPANVTGAVAETQTLLTQAGAERGSGTLFGYLAALPIAKRAEGVAVRGLRSILTESRTRTAVKQTSLASRCRRLRGGRADKILAELEKAAANAGGGPAVPITAQECSTELRRQSEFEVIVERLVAAIAIEEGWQREEEERRRHEEEQERRRQIERRRVEQYRRTHGLCIQCGARIGFWRRTFGGKADCVGCDAESQASGRRKT